MVELPRHVIDKPLKSGKTGYYYNVPTRYRELKCNVPNEALGTDFAAMCKRAKVLNGLFDEWDTTRKGLPVTGVQAPKIGTVDWLFREYKQTKAYLEKVDERSRSDYEWAMLQLCDLKTKRGDRVGGRPIKTITPLGADKLYDKLLIGPRGKKRHRTAEKIVKLCRKAWRVVHRLYPDQFNNGKDDIPNPWLGVTLESRVKLTKKAVTREQVYTFAQGAIEGGYPEAAATAVICFEWLQRPENVVAGHITWSDYRAPSAPSIIRVAHHKTGTIAPHPLEEITNEGVVRFYADAEEVLAKLPRLGVPMILRDLGKGSAKPWRYSSLNHVVARLRKRMDLPSHFTLDACRHGGMTELEEAELTDGQGRALSTHKTQQSYEGYAKRTAKRMLSATRKRHAHRIANETATAVQNEHGSSVQNGNGEEVKSA
jgi:integrase